ncbi:unnamed protein product [Miscanthus lutarioriparius]|uniref:No apical meristem-associated C-terminal domain-containing protein n=1 Tax=Miscanthus lutarioriparius TaxID=422564 RepID=A0A811MXI9_9POAL|nr:unnamed protein product [Miscanthus lutarioriparius]
MKGCTHQVGLPIFSSQMASAWLRNSKDPVDGTDRKADQYWADVTEEYNKNTEVCRRRNQNQLKIRWDRVKKPVMDFHGCWNRTTKVYRSGVSDDQLMEIAKKMYAGEHNDKEFTLKQFWKVVRNERKWSAYVKKEQEKEKNKSAADSPSEVVNLEDNPKICPIGHKKAKAELYGKKKTPEAFSAITDKLDKFIEVSTLARKDREKMAETQQIMAKSKVEAARLTDKVFKYELGVQKLFLLLECMMSFYVTLWVSSSSLFVLLMSNQPPSDAEPQDEDGSIYPEELYTFEEFEAEQEVLEDLQDEMVA